jgi:exodeoxyribonuclease-3
VRRLAVEQRQPPLATPAVAEKARAESIYKAEKFSDHAPLTVTYDLAI